MYPVQNVTHLSAGHADSAVGIPSPLACCGRRWREAPDEGSRRLHGIGRPYPERFQIFRSRVNQAMMPEMSDSPAVI
jgi:hypothetical protein